MKKAKASLWIRVTVVVALLAILALLWFGCASQRARVTPGSTELTKTTEAVRPDGTKEKVTVKASGTGAALDAATSDGSVLANFKGSAPAVKLEGLGEGQGGASDADIKITGKAKTALLIMGGLFVLGGVGCLWLGIRQVAMAMFVAGGSMIAAWMYPVLLAVAIGVMAIAAAWVGWKYLRNHEALRAVAAGIEANPIGSQIKEEIAKHADARDKATINRIKEKDGL